MAVLLAFLLVAMTLCASAALILPLLRGTRPLVPRTEFDLRIYRDQLAELDHDRERGLISAEMAQAARLEIERRMLAASAEAALPERPRGIPWWAVAAIALFIPLSAASLYAAVGSPGVPDRPFAARPADAQATDTAGPGHDDMDRLLADLATRLSQKPDDLAGWQLLARSLFSRGRYQESAEAFRHVYEQGGRKPEYAADLAEALVQAEGGAVSRTARDLFDASLRDPASAARAGFYLGLAALQEGDAAKALRIWKELERSAPPDAPWVPMLREQIAKVERLDQPPQGLPPGSEDMAKTVLEANPADQQAMIRSMVARLADKMKADPANLAGWLRLGRAYAVLNEPAKAREAYGHALELSPGNADARQGLDSLGPGN